MTNCLRKCGAVGLNIINWGAACLRQLAKEGLPLGSHRHRLTVIQLYLLTISICELSQSCNSAPWLQQLSPDPACLCSLLNTTL
jgi:hypothetical protein